MNKVVRMPRLRPPVFKIRARIQVWRRDDPQCVSTTILAEEVVLTTPNRRDMEAIARSSALGRLARLGVNTTALEDQFESVVFFAGRSRTYDGGVELDWVPATEDLVTKEQAIRDMTYLPYDLAEQHEVYGA